MVAPCVEEIVGSGTDLPADNTENDARDVRALMSALGYLEHILRTMVSGRPWPSRLSDAGTFSMIEILAPGGWETPWHVHDTHDEYFHILEGSVTARVGDATVVLDAGDFAFGRVASRTATRSPTPAPRVCR